MNLGFDPFLPWPVLAALFVIAAALTTFALFRKLRGALIRAVALAALGLALANPIASIEEREPVKSIAVIVVDRSPSQMTPDRKALTDATLASLTERLSRYSGFETRVIEAKDDPDATSPSTRLFEALQAGIRDIPVSRIAGAVMITDGQIHDLPETTAAFGFPAPLHGLITGRADEFDRRIEVVRAPRFGIAGKEQEITYRVMRDGGSDTAPMDVTIRVNGEIAFTDRAAPGEETPAFIEIPRGGENVIELAVATEDGEVTDTNNRAVVLMQGIRENLRVLLVSGEPHSGERAWRNLLKSDASVDLVHFTILRPPEKQDGTPISELSLIAFPTRELFVEKISDFDLIIFDRYQNRGVLPVLYYDYIARYVEEGGAMLIAAGPELATEGSVAGTPLAPALPAMPTGDVTEAGYYPRLSDEGKKHPVTRDLPGATREPPQWGRWFRTIGVGETASPAVMTGANDEPLLILNRYGEGRVAMLLSDHGWLWARGFEGGGPHVALYRRIAHWLMQEPSLEEEALTASAEGRALTITRQTMGESAGPATVRLPSGATLDVPLEDQGDGRFTATITLEEPGLVEVVDGDFTALTHVGAVDSPEFRAMVSTTDVLSPLAGETGGTVTRVTADASSLPQILPVRAALRDAGGRLTLKSSGESVLKGVQSLPLFGGFLGLALLLFAFGTTWWREGR